MNITIINDCRDENAKGRQVTRAQSLFNVPVNFIGVENDSEASGMLIDTLDAYGTAPGVMLANVAPRSKHSWWLSESIEHFDHFNGEHNGTPFGYLRVENVLIVTTIGGYMLSLIKKLKMAESVAVLSYHDTCAILQKEGTISKEEARRIETTQFRSFDFLPRAAHALMNGVALPHTKVPLSSVADAPKAVWFSDNFGNMKTTLTLNDFGGTLPPSFEWEGHTIPCFPKLKDVPESTLGAAVGSSGYKENRFIEIYIQGGNARAFFTEHTS